MVWVSLGADAVHRRAHRRRRVGVVRPAGVRERGRRARHRRHLAPALAAEAPTLVTFAAEVVAADVGAGAVRPVLPAPAIRRELRLRLAAAGVLGDVGGLRWRLAPLVLGRPPQEPGADTMIDLVLPGSGLAAVGPAGIVVAEALVRRAEVGAGLLLGATLLSAALVSRSLP